MKIHHVWFGSDPWDQIQLDFAASWKVHNPRAELVLWADSPETLGPVPHDRIERIDAHNWICQHEIEAATVLAQCGQKPELEARAAKSDILRAEIVYREGGLYVDDDTICLKPVQEFLERYPLALAREYGGSIIGNAMIWAAQPYHRGFERFFSIVTRGCNDRLTGAADHRNTIGLTGPTAISRSLATDPECAIVPYQLWSPWAPNYRYDHGQQYPWPDAALACHIFRVRWRDRWRSENMDPAAAFKPNWHGHPIPKRIQEAMNGGKK